MLINYQETLKTIKQIRSGDYKEGEKLDIPEVDEYIRFKPSNLNVILGHANVGKTSMILFLMLCYTLKHKKRWLVYSSENEPHSILRKLIEYLIEKPINKVSDKELEYAQKFIFDHFKIISNEKSINYKELLELATAVKKAWDYDGFFIDPYNSITKDREMLKSLGGHEYDYQCTTDFRIFCKHWKVSIWLNTHANTEAQRKRHRLGHTYEDMPIPPFSADAEGGSKFVNRCDDFFVIHRYTQHPADYIYTHFIVRKVKEIETGGRPTPYEEPIMFRSLVNNVGYAINNDSIIKTLKHTDLPF
jgi:hypothetical protein